MAGAQSTLLQNATIITYEEVSKDLRVLRNASMLIQDGRIAKLSEGNIDVASEVEVVDASNKIISPGFVNTHHHLWQSAFRSIAGNTTLFEYFVRYGQTGPASKEFTVDDVYLGQLAACLEMIDGGTTTVLDHAHATFSDDHIDAVVKADFDSGLRVYNAPLIGATDLFGRSYEQGIEKFKSLLADPRFSDPTCPMEMGIAYDGFAYAPPERSMEIMKTVIEHNKSVDSGNSGARVNVLTSHFVGGPYGANNSPSLLDSMPTSVVAQPDLQTKLPVILSHASFLDQKDILILRRNPHVTVSTTPESEAHYGHTSYGADMCQDCASLGVDTHFTYSSYMPYQARLWLQLLRTKWYTQTVVMNGEVPISTPMKVEDAFLLATQKGGEALGCKHIGVINVGAQADLAIFSTERPGMWATADPVAAIVLHSGGGGDVDSVMVQGKWLKRDGTIISPLVGSSFAGQAEVAVDDIKKRFFESAKRIQGVWKDMEKPVFTAGNDTGFGLARFGSCRQVIPSTKK